jgi:hypothetical protein
VLATVAVLALTLWLIVPRGGSPGTLPIPGEDIPLAVEVLNATAVDGLAREVTRRLRRKGIDVVSFGTATRQGLDTTLILVRRGDRALADPIVDALGTGRVLVELDARLLLDASILVGRDLAPVQRDP